MRRFVHSIFWAALAAAVLLTSLMLGCGGGSANSGSGNQATPSSAQNDAVVERASQAPDAIAQEGEAEVRGLLRQELGMNREGSFRLHPNEPTECDREAAEESKETGLEIECTGDASDCYVKTGAEAVDFEYERQHILRSPDGANLVFVQTYQGVPLYECLVAVRNALDW